MLEALVAGTTDPQVLAELARGQLRKKLPALREALEGRVGSHHALLVGEMLARIDQLDESIQRLRVEVARVLVPFSPLVALLVTIPGVDRRTAEVVLAEIGPDMGRFPSSAHLASWAGVCPGNHESAGKHSSGRTRKGSKWLGTALVQAANAAARSKDTSLAAHHQRSKGRRGHHKAIVAVAHSILVIIWHLLTGNQPYSDLGGDYVVQRHHSEAYKNRLIRQLEGMRYKVTVEPLNP
jgi:transposase